jgi:hypothetical protein
MAGGTVTISGGNVIHTFNSSGYLTPLKLVNNSLRFRNTITGSPSSPAYLERTFPTAGNQQKWTFSVWIKKTLGRQTVFGRGSTQFGALQFGSDDTLGLLYAVGGTTYAAVTTQVFRDPAAWYHLVWSVDTTQATASNRQRLYVNGTEVTAWSSYTNIPQNSNGNINTANSHWIGNFWESGFQYPFSGYMTEVNFIDGQQLTANSFGTFNSYGVWQPITYGGSYGTNGFYLPFTKNTVTYAGSFNGSSQYLTFTDSSNVLDMGGATTSFEGFVYISGSLSTGKDIFGKQGGSASWSTSNGWEYILYINSSYKFSFQYNNAGSPATIADTTARNIGQWYWVVVATDASNNISMFVDGVKVATATNAITKPTTRTTMWVLAENGPGSVWLGSASNFRFVSGSNAYSPTATSLTVPTTNLTAVTGTQLLTLQNATIIDNSTNAFSITNNGSVTTAQTYPFSAGYIFNDQGPAGNNWTPNNISGASGSTLDYMTDVPTLTSATAANYCVMNPLDKASIATVSSGNLNITSNTSGSWGQVRGTMAMVTGKWYWEVTLSTVNTEDLSVGIGNETTSLSLNFAPSSWANVYVMFDNGDLYANNSSTSGYGSSFANGDVFMVAFDRDNSKIYFGRNGTWFNSSNPATQTNPAASSISTSLTFFPMTGAAGFTPPSGLHNFGQQPFAYTPPSGFLALNTYNI